MKAFPISAQSLEKHNGRDLSGMDLRDYFAAKAMQGYMSRTLIIICHAMRDVEYPAMEIAERIMGRSE